jgi:enterochelin esterase-like enzyme
MRTLHLFTICLFSPIFAHAQKDASHFSSTFKTSKLYRIYLPSDYSSNLSKRYPVIYYFHGNKGDHRLKFDSVAQLANRESVIVVAWNGRSSATDDRPYNTGYHSNINYHVQFKDYFPEFIQHIDKTYRTHADRSHRALIGHSMGGFMSFYLAGKYPHLVSVAVSSKGSPEFFLGYPKNHTLIQHRYLFKNLHGVKLRFQNGTVGEELVHLNTEVHQGALREARLDYSYQDYEGGHSLTFREFKDAFNFVMDAFKQPRAAPERWHHADHYPNFNVWGYEVKSNLAEPGFIELENVTRGGLTTQTRKWQPDGILIPGVHLNIKTAARYKPRTSYTLLDYNNTTGAKKTTTVTSDNAGRIAITANYQQHFFGIYEKQGAPELVVTGYKADNEGRFLKHRKPSSLQLHLLNRGGTTASGLKITLSSSTAGVSIENPTIALNSIESGQLLWTQASFKITANNNPPGDGTTPYIRFNLSLTDEKGNTWSDEFDALVMYDVPKFADIGIDDGDSEIYGSGNGNNVAEPGETVMIYQHSHRTKLYYDDQYVDAERIHDDLQPDKWGDGYALSSLIRISKDCPPGHVIRFLACYEVKEWKTIKRNVTWGTFTIKVSDLPISESKVDHVQYTGRVEKKDAGLTHLYWPGTSVTTTFNGSMLNAVLHDEKGHNTYKIVIDDDSSYDLRLDSIKRPYTLASKLRPGTHTVTLYRLTDWFNGVTSFHGFQYEQGTTVLPVKSKKRKLEFYGNSITVGAGMRERDSTYRGPGTNNYHSYGAITARHFNAGYTCIGHSGIGLMVSWGSLIMPEIYNRLNPDDSVSIWNFSKEAPDIVVVNLFENDCALFNMPEHAQFKRRFGNKAPDENVIIAEYYRFVKKLRGHYPHAHIICTLGSMGAVKPGSPWPGYINSAVATLNDQKIYTHFFPYVGSSGHPNLAEHRAMASGLISFIDQHIRW